MTEAIPNANFISLGGTSVHDCNTDSRYIEYRRQWIENPKNFTVNEFPVHLDIEVTNRCNLRCTFCDKLPYLLPGDFGDIDAQLFKKIIDEGKEHNLCSIKLSYRGEPLLHPQLGEMIAYAKKKSVIDIYFNTNAMLLTEEKINELIDSGLNRISISIEGTDPELFEMHRKGAKFHVVLANIDKLLELRAKRGVSFPQVRIQTVRFPDLNLEEYASFWKSHCDEIAAVDYKEPEDRQTDLVDEGWACPQLWQRMTIEWDGKIMPCNNDDYRKLSPGNVNQISVNKSWLSPHVTSARKLHKEGKSHLVEACNGCHWRTTQILKKCQ